MIVAYQERGALTAGSQPIRHQNSIPLPPVVGPFPTIMAWLRKKAEPRRSATPAARPNVWRRRAAKSVVIPSHRSR